MSKILKKAMIFMLAAIMVCCAAVFAACDDDTDNSGGTVTEKYTIEGVVASELGPISGVTVKLGSETKTTGSAGSYSFEVSAGEYTLTFTKTGYTDVQKSVKTADAVNGTVKLNVSMTVQEKEYFVISGTVSGEEGAIANATVSGSALSETVTADANGAFTLPQLEKKGSYTFTFAASGYVSADKTVNAAEIEGSAHTLNVTLEKIPEEQLATVSGVVTADYPAGAIDGVTVKIGTTEVKTDANGAYSVQTSRDACTVEFIKNGYAKVTNEVTAEELADGTHTLNAELVRNTVLAGKTNAALVDEYATMNNIAVSGQLKDQMHAASTWKEGGAEGSAAGILSEGYQMESKQDNANDDYRRYVYGKMIVSADNKIVTLYGRTFSSIATECAVKVIIPDTLESKLIKEKTQNTEWATLNSNTTVSLTFDLSEYVGKNIILAIGVRKAALTVERIIFGPGEFVFGRTTQAEFESAKTLDLTQKTSFENAEIRSAFDINGNIEGKNSDNDYVTKSARFYACYVGQNTAADADLFMYAYAKVNITAANARMSVRWYRDRAPKLRVEAYDSATKGLIKAYDSLYNGSEERTTENAQIDLTDCIGKTVVLAIGMTSGERLDLQKISFARYSYTLKGTVTLPEGGEYDLSKVSFKLNNESLTSGEDGFTYTAASGAYELALTADATGTLTVSYDNSDIADDTQKLLGATYALSGAATQDEVTQNFELQQNSNAPQTINITLNADTALTENDAEIKLGTHDFTYTDGKWSLDRLTMADAVALGNVTITLKGKYANIYADPSFTLTTSDYSGGSANKEITLKEKDILPGLTFSQMQNAKTLDYDYYQGHRAHSILRSFAKSNPLRSEEQNEGDTIRVIENSAKSASEFNGYIYGVRTISEATKTMTVNMRTHDTSNDTIFGVMVVDLESGARALIGGLRTSRQNSYNDVTFDLTEYVGKRVLIATGIFYTDECTRWDVQYVMHHIRFYNLESDWGSTVDTLASNLLNNTGVAGQSINDFVGSANDKDKSNYIFSTWGTASKNFESADYELNAGEGALIKTRNDEWNVENCVFLYSKFSITAQNNYLRFNARGFGGNMPELAVTVYSLGTNGEVVEKIITPDISAFDLNGNQVTDMGGGWISGSWSTDNYTQFKWDLSEFEGQEVVIMIGLRNTQGGENKIAIQQIHLEAKPQESNQENN
ncbi:carboxypeptidase-like regulatory domain-containing protein [Pumilibacter intestinalis]|uniref:carboxypeptidase-like regulatory domain-containing protein n=1 Tax=Pumilibacter intestinalis TaxID=2941511 RepID=UPI00203BDEC4|nr:carboxypeptidase-like regulatory domain-containing protein [Pumilibacter intestinalis]